MRKLAFFAAAAFLLAVTGWFHFYSWTAIEGPPAPPGGYIAMTIGMLYAIAVAVALALLVFVIRSRS